MVAETQFKLLGFMVSSPGAFKWQVSQEDNQFKLLRGKAAMMTLHFYVFLFLVKKERNKPPSF